MCDIKFLEHEDLYHHYTKEHAKRPAETLPTRLSPRVQAMKAPSDPALHPQPGPSAPTTDLSESASIFSIRRSLRIAIRASVVASTQAPPPAAGPSGVQHHMQDRLEDTTNTPSTPSRGPAKRKLQAAATAEPGPSSVEGSATNKRKLPRRFSRKIEEVLEP